MNNQTMRSEGVTDDLPGDQIISLKIEDGIILEARIVPESTGAVSQNKQILTGPRNIGKTTFLLNLRMADFIKKDMTEKVRRSLHDELYTYFLKVENVSGRHKSYGLDMSKRQISSDLREFELAWMRVLLKDTRGDSGSFSTAYLTETVLPYVDALIHIQKVLDEIQGKPGEDVRILSIFQGSVNIDLTGGIRDSIELVRDSVVPWRREHQRTLAEKELAEKELALKLKRVEVAEAKAAVERADGVAENEAKRMEAEAEKTRAEAEKLRAEALTVKAQARQMDLANHRSELELMGLALEMVKKIKPDVSESELLLYAMKFVDPARVIATSPLELVDAQYFGGEEDDEETDSTRDE